MALRSALRSTETVLVAAGDVRTGPAGSPDERDGGDAGAAVLVGESDSLVGEFLTVQEMGGFQLCIAKLDEELIELYDAPCDTPSLTVK